jgi:hypothetical protein
MQYTTPDDWIEVPGLTRTAIRVAAVSARAALGIHPDGRVEPRMLLERLWKFGVILDIVDDADPSVPPHVEALYWPESSTLVIRESVYEAMCSGQPRARFTFGHELGHIVLGHRRTLNRVARDAPVPIYCRSEWQANHFSAEVTMPLDVINSEQLFSASSIAARFGVSLAAADSRLRNLTKYNELKKKPPSVDALGGF